MKNNKKEFQIKSSKKEFQNNMAKSYAYKNRGLEIKLSTMELLYEQLQGLVKESQGAEGSELHIIIELMAKIGQAILPD